MRIRAFPLALLSLSVMLFHSCDDGSQVVAPKQLSEPPLVIQTGIQLAVGNTYHWRYTEITSLGAVYEWDQTDNIVSETTIQGLRYFVFDTGLMLRSAGDAVMAYDHDSESVYYRFDVSLAQTVPSLGSMLRVAAVDTDSVFSEIQKIVTVSTQGFSPMITLDQARYSTKFGLLGTVRSERTSVTRGVLLGARIGAVRYGF